MRITTDLVVGIGLVAALLLSLVLGGPSELQTNLAAGLTGYLGRAAVEHTPPEEKKTIAKGESEK